jgi:glycosyltransferase involved in cell wall biosynthesis
MISILILTKNEERNLPGCLESIRWSDDVHVFDSHSSDRTCEVASSFGARVTSRQFDSWAEHQNWALSHIPFRYPWVFYLDADERVTPELAMNLRLAVEGNPSAVAFRVQRRDFFLGRWLKHVQTTPFYLRLFRPEKMRYERLVNPLSIPDGPVGELSGYLDHFPFSKGMTQWVERHNSYSTLEAQQILANRATGGAVSFRRAILAPDFNERRYHQKELFYRIPCRPVAKFLLLYIARAGFLDGRAGFSYAVLQAFYEYMIVLKTRELSANSGGCASREMLAHNGSSRVAAGAERD